MTDMPKNKGEFTPGPWVVQREPDGDYTIWATRPFTHLLATVVIDDDEIPTNVAANAFVIGAAGAMFNALLSARDMALICQGDTDAEVVEAANIALNRIDKAIELAEAQS